MAVLSFGKDKKMAYRKRYPDESRLNFILKDSTLSVYFTNETAYSPDLWSIKYLFDKRASSTPANVCINGKISKTMALRMHFLQYLFPHIRFHDSDGDKFITDAKEIISNIEAKKYITYDKAPEENLKDHPFCNRPIKNKPESLIEKELADNLSKYVKDFSAGAEVIRQFPANIFKNRISEESRITDKLWIDMVSMNGTGEVSPIELKVGGNIPLDLFAQGLDYGIYCHLFKEHIRDNWFNRNDGIAQNKVTIYYVGEKFHPALVGKEGEDGIVSLIRENALFNIVFVEITVNGRRITKSKVIFPKRNQ
jgi:hypothetical protein